MTFFSTAISIIVMDIGITLNWWIIKETAYLVWNIAYIFRLHSDLIAIVVDKRVSSMNTIKIFKYG